jgi:aldose sugar dehydrogenase
MGGDEINHPEAGKNYGWPIITFGLNYNGAKIGVGTAAEGLEQPVFYWDPSIAPSGLMIYSGKLFPQWAGDMFVGSLKFDMISRLDVNGETVSEAERLFQDEYRRIRDIREAPDGSIWFLSVGERAAFRISPMP